MLSGLLLSFLVVLYHGPWRMALAFPVGQSPRNTEHAIRLKTRPIFSSVLDDPSSETTTRIIVPVSPPGTNTQALRQHHRPAATSKIRITTVEPKESVILSSPPDSHSDTNNHVKEEGLLTLIPLSPNPLLFLSSTPLLTSEECQVLAEWCRFLDGAGYYLSDILDNDQYVSPGKQILQKLQRLVHESVLGMKDATEAAHVVPRFLHYQSSPFEDNKVTVDRLLPDGLHVDTNNNKHFRHWTVLVYLDSPPSTSAGGATTFPLAERFGNNFHRDFLDRSNNAACNAAQELVLNANIQHTRISKDDRFLNLGRTIEEAALQLYVDEAFFGNAAADSSPNRQNRGVRVVPRQGHACVFSGLLHNGYPNPLSFHAGEAMLQGGAASKHVLTFFYEVPYGTFSNRAEFGEQVRIREEAFLRFHGLI